MKYNDVVEQLCRRQVLLARHSSYAIGGRADYFAMPERQEDLALLLEYCHRKGMPYVVFGLGSNILFPDDPPEDTVFISLKGLMDLEMEGDGLQVSCGVPLSFIALIGLILSWPEAQFTHLLPGTLGAGVYMNARCFEGEMADILDTVLFLDLAGNPLQQHRISADLCSFGYKHSIFQEKDWLILGATLTMPSSGTEEFRTIQGLLQSLQGKASHLSDLESFYTHFAGEAQILSKGQLPPCCKTIETYRQEKYHFQYPSCGSVFKNNYDVGEPIGALVEKLGLKGQKSGSAMISPHHGNMILNCGGARAQDVLNLMEIMSHAIEKHFNFIPEPEVVVIQGR